MVAVTYHAPTSLDEAVALLSSSELPAKVLAGGTDLIIQMQKLVTEQRLIVDLKKIDGMQLAHAGADEIENCFAHAVFHRPCDGITMVGDFVSTEFPTDDP